jgi:hypothetical protein
VLVRTNAIGRIGFSRDSSPGIVHQEVAELSEVVRPKVVKEVTNLIRTTATNPANPGIDDLHSRWIISEINPAVKIAKGRKFDKKVIKILE